MNSADFGFQGAWKEFQEVFETLPSRFMPRSPNPHTYLVGPDNDADFDLCLSVLVHGNEVGGLVAVTELFKLLASNDISFGKKIAVLVGNIEAAKANRRFIDRDLNRSFNLDDSSSYEGAVAQVLETTLRKSRFLVDLHQTQDPSLTDFFIFPRVENNIRYSWFLGKDIPTVVHDLDFSADGMCMDSYLAIQGGIGLTYEMGYLSESSIQIPKALRLLSRAMALSNVSFPLNAPLPSSVFIFDQTLKSQPGLNLMPGFVNFQAVAEGELIATNGDYKIFAQSTGHILFPQYSNNAVSEICHLVKSVPLQSHLFLNELQK